MLAPIHCESCGDLFYPGNSRARFCGGACRARAHRARHRPTRARKIALVQSLQGMEPAVLRDRLRQPDAQELIDPVLLGALLALSTALA